MAAYAAYRASSWRRVISDQLIAKGMPRATAVQRVRSLIGPDAVMNLNAMNRIGAARGLVNAAINTIQHG